MGLDQTPGARTQVWELVGMNTDVNINYATLYISLNFSFIYIGLDIDLDIVVHLGVDLDPL